MKMTGQVIDALSKAARRAAAESATPEEYSLEGKPLTLNGEGVANFTGGPPIKPPQVKLFDNFQPARGIYLLTSNTGVGKTATLMGLVMYSNAVGIPATYASIFEPRETEGAKDVFKAGKTFIATLEKAALFNATVLRILALDSVTGPLKDFSSTYPDQSTFAGGMQPSDRAFLVEGARKMHAANMIGIWAVNQQLIPYVNDLAGSTEGLITVLAPGEFTYHDRTALSKRKTGQRVLIPKSIMTRVFELLS